MRWFKKKKQQPEQEEKVIHSPCEIFGHTWKDFPPYMESIWYGHDYTNEIKIIEPYVCLCCKQRKDVLLSKITKMHLTKTEFNNYIDTLAFEYKSILKPRPIVEDMINDAIYVDREKLNAWEQLHGENVKEEFKLVIPESKKLQY